MHAIHAPAIHKPSWWEFKMSMRPRGYLCTSFPLFHSVLICPPLVARIIGSCLTTPSSNIAATLIVGTYPDRDFRLTILILCCPRFASVILHYRVSIRRVRLALQQQQEAATFLKHDTLYFAWTAALVLLTNPQYGRGRLLLMMTMTM